MSSDVLMKDVAMGEKVFVKFEGAIRQVKVIGFETIYNSSCGGNNWAEYTLYMGGDKAMQLNRANFGYDNKMYRTVADAVDDKPIKTVWVSPEDFTKAYMDGMCMAYSGRQCFGYQWSNNKAERYIMASDRPQIKHLNGKTTFIGAKPNPKLWYQSAEECRAHNAPKVVYLDD